MKNRFFVCVGLMFALNTVSAQEVLNLMFYNLLQFPSVGDANRIYHLQAILNATRPDLLMVCELNNQEGANLIEERLQALDSNYIAAPFWTNTSDDNGNDQNSLQNLIFFDQSKFILEDQDVVVTYLRDFNHYTLKLNTTSQATDPVVIHVFVGHLKASSGSDNEQLRLDMVEDFTTYLESLDSNAYVILSGDFNLYSSNEPAYLELLDSTNNITLADPVNRSGDWHNNLDFLDVFSQSTHATSGGGFASGGFDDRFDFILTSTNLLNGGSLTYVEDSYNSVGNNNNSNCFNQSINSPNCDGDLYDASLREHLYNMSDHLPIRLQLNSNDSFLSSTSFEDMNKDFHLAYNQIKDGLEVEVNSRIFGTESYLLIYDNMGRLISETPVGSASNLFIQSSHWSNGQYLVKSNLSAAPPQKFIKY